MPRKPMQDIVPSGKSIRNVPIPESRVRPAPLRKTPAKKKEAPVERIIEKEKPVEELASFRKATLSEKKKAPPRVVEPVIVPEPEPEPEPEVIVPKNTNWETLEEVRREFEASAERTEQSGTRGKSRRRKIVFVLVIALVLGVAFGLSSLFHSASIALSPRTASTSIDKSYTARKDATGSTLGYQVVTVKEIASETVKATGERKVDRKAQGTIVIYNNYSATAQRLVKNTRFQTPEGLIFRITDSVTVPGKKGTTPGSVDATVVADEAGDSYNVGLKDFTIPGFKGDPRYTAFYARSKTPIAGGFSGIEKVVADEDRARAKASIEAKLSEELHKRAPTLVPVGAVSLGNSYDISFSPLTEKASGSDVTLSSEGTLSLVVFDAARLSQELAQNLGDYEGEPILVTNLAALDFAPKGDFDPAGKSAIDFSVKGKAQFKWQYDELALKQALAGKPRSEANEILKDFPMVERADISLRPAWVRSFPDTLDKITVKDAQ